MKLWTWDTVIQLAESQAISHQKFKGEPNQLIDLKGGADLSSTIIA
jgi:hypothetical protein